MQLIPVIDLKGKKAVRAVRGERANYRPWNLPGCGDGDPVEALRLYRAIHPFPQVYIADLDAIAGGEANDDVLARLRDAEPDVALIVDNGINDEAAARRWLAQGLGRLVIGAENHPPAGLARELGTFLSLDYRGDDFIGPEGLDRQPALWPDDIIVMTLARVGSGEGPDMAKLQAVRRAKPGARVYAAGGVRGVDDLRALAGIGVAGALVATAVLSGAITSEEIANLPAWRPSA